ncbi:MAG: hypothetical protein HY903_11645 [Deltaproteobacteria bacterium]|nr:hypothetical protein [Deltaproteobacteria bacterium]
MAHSLRIVAYAVDGGGIGHLNRMVALSRWLRRYAAHMGRRAEIYVLTTSEADGLLLTEKLAGFKLPSPTVAHDAGIDRLGYLAMAKQWVWHSLGLLRPDLLIVDTWPRGAFGELLSALDLCRRKAFIYRPVKDEVAASADFQAMLPLYDRVLVPEEEGVVHVQVPKAAEALVSYVGPVMVRERAEQHSRIEARDHLGVVGDRLAVYVSAGGGGDPGAEEHLLSVVTALCDDPSLHLVVGAGPLYRGRVLAGERITWLAHGGVSELMAAFDLAICGAGYNTFAELMHAGVPTIFVPQHKLADDQAARAARAVAAGAAIVLGEGLLGSEVERAVADFRDPERRRQAGLAARRLVPENHARRAAAELLRLLVPARDVDRAEAAIGDEVLRAARDCRVGYQVFVDLMRALDTRDSGASVEEETSAGEVSELAVALLRFITDRALPVVTAVKLVAALSQKLPRALPAERAAAARRLLPELAAFNDWTAATAFLRMINSERRLPAAELAALIGDFLSRLRARREDLYRGIAYVSEAVSAGTYPAGIADLPVTGTPDAFEAGTT